MSNVVIRVFKNSNSTQAPEIALPENLSDQELSNPELVNTAHHLLKTDGVLVIRNLFVKALIASLHEAFVERYQEYFDDRDDANILKVGDKRKMLTIDLHAPFDDPALYGNPLLLPLMEQLLGEEFVLGSFGAVIALPGAEEQHSHRDHPPLFEDEALDLKIPSFAMTVVIPLIDLTPATGATRIWKGSHRVSVNQSLDIEESSIPFVSTGSCYLMDYQLFHGGTPNHSALVRPILYLVYYRSWFQEAVNYEQQSRVAITQSAYLNIPEPYKFLFVRQREALGLNSSPELKVSQDRSQPIFENLTAKEQAKQLEAVAKAALASYGFKQVYLELITHGENTVFSVTAPDTALGKPDRDCYQVDRFILRIHRTNYLAVDEIDSELVWLQYLSQEADFPVPAPISTLEGRLYTLVDGPGLLDSRLCSLTRWLKGRSFLEEDGSNRLRMVDLAAIGQLLGRLHDHAAHWPMPEGFTRPTWNWQGLFGTGAGYSNNGARVWELTPQPYRDLFTAVSQQVQSMMASLGESPDQFGLIHGDFWLGNLLVNDRTLHLIDFADCGFGYWGYDLARFLNDFSTAPDFEAYVHQVLTGYNQIRTFPAAQLAHLYTFLAAQQVALALWQINRAQDHPSFRNGLEAELYETAIAVEQLLSYP